MDSFLAKSKQESVNGVFRWVLYSGIAVPILGEFVDYLERGFLTPTWLPSLLLSIGSLLALGFYLKIRKSNTIVPWIGAWQIACYSWALYIAGGIRAEAFIFVGIFPLVYGFLAGKRGVLTAGAICAVMTSVFFYFESAGILPQKSGPLGIVGVLSILSLGLTTLIVFKYERVKARNEEVLQSLAERQEKVLEGAGLGTWDWWLDSNQVHFDRRWCEMLGLDFESVEHKLSTWDERVHPDDKAKAYEDIKRYLEGKTSIYENVHRLRHTNGSWVWVLDRGRISQKDINGRPVRFTGTHLDITDYKNSELLSSEIQKIAKIGGWELDPATGNTKWTAETYRIHGLPIGTPTNKINGISFYAPHDRPRIAKYVEECIAGKPYEDDFEFFDKNGNHLWVRAMGAPIWDAQGNVSRIIGTFQDITLLVKAQELAKQERAKSIQSSKLASLGEMSAGIAHEINNPLAAISGNLDLLERYLGDPEKLKTKISNMKKSVERIEKIISGLRKFSRTTEKSTKKSEPVGAIVSEVLSLVEHRAKRFSVEVQADILFDGNIVCDSVEIEQVLINLINNAVDAVKNLPEKWVGIKGFQLGNEFVLQITDSGLGISEGLEEKLFQPFFTTKPAGEGTGLGLSIAKGIIEDHKGRIFVNREFKNTCFELRLPLEENSASPSGNNKSSNSSAA